MDPTAGYSARLPSARPRGLRLHQLRASWYRLDATSPDRWDWTPFPTPRYRFDSSSGTSRTRYAGDSPRVAMRERFDATGRIVRTDELDQHLIELSGAIRILDLRRDVALDALGLDDQINTSRAPGVWSACQQVSDLVHGWFGGRCDGLVYRSRTTPQRSANLAFFERAPLTARSLGPLREHTALIDSCILSDGFAIQGWG